MKRNPTKAWAVINDIGEIEVDDYTNLCVYSNEGMAELRAGYFKIIPVLITPVKKGKK